MTHVVGIDTSTTATKAIVVDEQGAVVGSGVSEYTFETPHPMWSEQDPELWWNGTGSSLRSALAAAGLSGNDVSAVGLAGQMHGLVLLDEKHETLRPAILWNDQRTESECDEIRTRVGADRLLEVTGNTALAGFTAPKLLWVRNNEPSVFAQATTALLPKDYVRLRLTDNVATDKAGAAGMLLFDLAARDWSEEVTAALDIEPSMLAPTHEGPETTGVVSKRGAAATGLAPGIPVVAGGGDQAANGVGTGIVDGGDMALSLGTSGVVFAATERPEFDREGRVHAFCHAVPERWHLMGVMLSAAGSLRWFRDAVAPDVSFDELVAEAAAVPAGADGLLFLPYLTGERTPHPDPSARGAFVGLTVRHTRAHLTRAILEGVAFGLRDGFDLMLGAGVQPPRVIRASGGGSRSALWLQIIADVLGTPVATVRSPEGAAYGAAMLAAVGQGWFKQVADAAAAWVATDAQTEPGPDTDRYRSLHDSFQGLYPALRPAMHDLAR